MKLPPDLKNEPDAVLLRDETVPLIDARLNPFTVALTFLAGDGAGEHPTGNGSGVLVQLEGRKFMLTAGHVLRDIAKAERCAITIRRGMHKFAPPSLGRAEYRFEKGVLDFGFIEFAPSVASTIEANEKMFAGPNTLLVEPCAASIAANDWMVMAGFPDEVSKKAPQATGYRLVHTSTTLAGCGPAPASVLGPDSHQAIDLWVPENIAVYSVTGKLEGNRVPAFAGASGGGAWKAGVRPIQAGIAWNVNKLKLVGIHIGSSDSTVLNGTPTRFAREVLIGHHLRLIADTTPALRAAVFARWPILNDPLWAP
jgi:hypothetical protein